MSTNAGTKQIDREADLYGFGTVFFDESQMANIIGFAPLVDKGFRVQYDSNIGDEFLITAPEGGETIFGRTPEGLYAYEPSPEFLNEVAKAKGIKPRTAMKRHQSHVIETVKGNMEGFTERQVRYAKLARKKRQF